MTTLASSGLSAGDVAGIIAAVFWAILVCFIGYGIVKLGKVFGEAGKLVAGVTDQTVPLLGEVTTSVVHVNTELERQRADGHDQCVGTHLCLCGDARLAGHQGRCLFVRRAPRAL